MYIMRTSGLETASLSTYIFIDRPTQLRIYETMYKSAGIEMANEESQILSDTFSCSCWDFGYYFFYETFCLVYPITRLILILTLNSMMHSSLIPNSSLNLS